jgi:hypothetical protein
MVGVWGVIVGWTIKRDTDSVGYLCLLKTGITQPL